MDSNFEYNGAVRHMKGRPVYLRAHEGSKGHCVLWKEAREDTVLCRMIYCLMLQVITS